MSAEATSSQDSPIGQRIATKSDVAPPKPHCGTWMSGDIAHAIGAWQVARARLAEDMTRERDGLWAALDEHRREQNLPRDWPDLFFRVEASEPGKTGDEEEEDVVV